MCLELVWRKEKTKKLKTNQKTPQNPGSFAKVVTSSIHVFRVHLYSRQLNGNWFYNAEQGVMVVSTQRQVPVIKNTGWAVYTATAD